MAYREVFVQSPDPREGHSGMLDVPIRADLEEIAAILEVYEDDIRPLYLDDNERNPKNQPFSRMFEKLIKETEPFIEVHKADGLNRLLIFTMMNNIRHGRDVCDLSFHPPT